jgi:pimeloyl-ACP methyl ester carboxylesterase
LKPWFLLLFFLACAGSADELWIGQTRFPEGTRFVRLRLAGTGGTLEMADALAPDGSPLEKPFTLGAVERQTGRLRFTATRDGVELDFAGEQHTDVALHTDAASGEVRRGEVRGAFSLLRLAAIPRAELDRYAGLYEFAGGDFVIVHFLQDLGVLTYVAYPSGRIGQLLPTRAGTFVSGPSLVVQFPVELRVEIREDRLEWREGGRVRRAIRRTFAEQNVVVESGGVRLAGTLTLPAGPSPHPAVVLLHGGGPQSRDFYWVAPFFARLGVAVLAYDKRGVGGSTGDWRSAGAADLAADALAAVDFLRSRPEIDPRRVGLYGSSNGGWVAPFAAARAPEKIAFLIARSASGLPERENVVYEVETDLRAHGFGADAIRQMRALHEHDMALVRNGGEGWNTYREELVKASAEPWFPLVRLPAKIFEMNAKNQPKIESWIASEKARWWQPADAWRKVRCPVLVQVGAADEYVPGERSVKIISEALRAGGNGDATVALLPGGNHALFELPGGSTRNLAQVTRFVPGYFAQLGDWITARVSRSRE